MDKLSIKLNIANRFYPMKIERSSEENIRNSVKKIDDRLKADDLEGAMEVCKSTQGPTASILYEGLKNAGSGPEAVEKAIQEIPGYPELFEKAFGSRDVTVNHIAKAIAQLGISGGR